MIETEFTGRGKIDVQRFKGLGEMNSGELKETTMDRSKRRLLRVDLGRGQARHGQDRQRPDGSKPEARFKFIQEHAEFAKDLDI